MKPTLVCDIETYHGYFLVAFKRLHDGKIVTFELSDRSEIDADRLRSIMLQHRIITYNGMSYDVPLIFYALHLIESGRGAAEVNAMLKRASDQIITGGVKYWEVEQLLGITIPRKLDHCDLIEPQPNAWASLKTLQGRLHGRKMRDLPIDPAATLSHADMDDLTTYCMNDLEATQNLYEALLPALEMRATLGEEYRMNFMSKSDSQCGEAIIKKRVEQLTGEKVERVNTPAGSSFPYKIPEYMKFSHPDLREMLDRLRATDFYVQADGKVTLPEWLERKQVVIGETTYAMGIGGLHSTESNRAVHADDEYVLIDADCASYYPAIILNSGLYPKALGKTFLDVYRKIRDDRVVAKRAGDKVTDQGLKIAINGTFGKLGSRYSILYAPHLMIAVTLTGQLALLMLIERAEAAGVQVVSGNTDGIVFKCPRDMITKIGKGAADSEGDLAEICRQWEAETGFELEYTQYRSIYNASVNSYIAIKEDGKAKIKGPLSDPRAEGDMRTQLMKNPQMTVISKAIVALLTKDIPLEDTIRGCADVLDFITVVNVKGGGTWRGEYLGKVVRYYWSTSGEEILYKTADPRTGNFKKVSKTDGCRPLMDLPDDDALPDDLDYDRYIAEAREVLKDIGAERRPPRIRPLRLYKWSAMAYFAVGV